MFSVVPVDEVGIPGPRVLERRERRRIPDRVLERLVPGLDMGVVVAAPRPGITAGHHHHVQERGERHAAHGVAVVGVDDFGNDAEIPDYPLEKSPGMLLRLRFLDGPADDGPVEEVDDGVGVIEQAVDVSPEPRYVPRPYLVRSRDRDPRVRGRADRLLALAPVRKGAALAQDAIERAHAAMVHAILREPRDDLLGRGVPEACAVRRLVKGLLLGG